MLRSTIHAPEASVATCHLSHGQAPIITQTTASPAGTATLAVVIVLVILLAGMATAARILARVASELLMTAASVVSWLFAIVAVLALAVLLALHR